MNFDDWQTLWQKQPVPPPNDPAALATTLRRVRAGARAFDRTILWRDLREGAAALLVSAVFAWEARAKTLACATAWHVWLAAALPLGVALFLFIDRWHARRRRPRGAATVLSEIDHALAELRHQHRLLLRVTWWYLLPLSTSIALIALPPILAATPHIGVRIVLGLLGALLLAAFSYPFRWINHRAATRELAPRIAALERERRDFSDSAPASSSVSSPSKDQP